MPRGSAQSARRGISEDAQGGDRPQFKEVRGEVGPPGLGWVVLGVQGGVTPPRPIYLSFPSTVFRSFIAGLAS
eukprot:1181097-Pyramimonas_sp.AAC.1